MPPEGQAQASRIHVANALRREPEAPVRKYQAIDHIAHERAHQLELRAEAHLPERGRLELGKQKIGRRLDGRLTRLGTTADVGHFAEAFAGVDEGKQPPI